MFVTILLAVFTATVVVTAIYSMLSLIGSSVYDIDLIQQAKKPTFVSKTKIRRYRPLVSIIIPVFNEEVGIQRCLDGLGKIKYKKIEIIVANDKSTDATKEIVKNYIKKNLS